VLEGKDAAAAPPTGRAPAKPTARWAVKKVLTRPTPRLLFNNCYGDYRSSWTKAQDHAPGVAAGTAGAEEAGFVAQPGSKSPDHPFWGDVWRRVRGYGAVSVRAQNANASGAGGRRHRPAPVEHSLTVSKQFADYLGRHGMHDREKVRESGAAFVPAAATRHRP
jgi:hypothetical protein